MCQFECIECSRHPGSIGMRKAVGDDWFLKSSRKGSPRCCAKSEQGERWVASGEYPIYLTARTKERSEELYDGGIEVRLLWPKEGAGSFSVLPAVVLADAPLIRIPRNFLSITSEAPPERAEWPKREWGSITAVPESTFRKREKISAARRNHQGHSHGLE